MENLTAYTAMTTAQEPRQTWRSWNPAPQNASGPQVIHLSKYEQLFDILRDPVFSDPIFRGTTDSTFTLTPVALRGEGSTDRVRRFSGFALSSEDELQSESAQRKFEYGALARFFQIADRQGLELPDDRGMIRTGLHEQWVPPNWFQDIQTWLPSDLLEVASLAQHYGVPTRLLDWTYNPLVAAYFASATSQSDSFAVWIFETQLMSSSVGVTGAAVELVTPRYRGNPNLAAQSGVLMHFGPSETSEDAPVDRRSLEDRYSGYPPPLTQVVLPRNQARGLRHALSAFGVNGASLFPGFDGVVRYILEDKFGPE